MHKTWWGTIIDCFAACVKTFTLPWTVISILLMSNYCPCWMAAHHFWGWHLVTNGGVKEKKLQKKTSIVVGKIFVYPFQGLGLPQVKITHKSMEIYALCLPSDRNMLALVVTMGSDRQLHQVSANVQLCCLASHVLPLHWAVGLTEPVARVTASVKDPPSVFLRDRILW